MREDEEFAKQAFDQYLADKGVTGRSWRDGTQNKSPDFYLTIESQEFVVEVTTIAEMVITPRKTVPRETIDRSNDDFVEAIEKIALAKGILSGTYYVAMPPLRRDYYAVRKPLEAAILDYLRSTQSDGLLPRYDITVDDEKYCSIQKSHKPDDRVIVGVYPPGAKWEIDAVTEACQLLQSAISGKKYRLRNSLMPKILILFNRYGYIGNAVFYRSCLPELGDLEAFHTIFVIDIENSNKDRILKTEDMNWE